MRDIIFPFWPNVDISAQMHESFPVFPRQTKDIDSMRMRPGGMTTTLVAAANLGLSTIPYGKIGPDAMGDLLVESYKELGIPTEYLVCEDGYETRKVFVLVDPNGHDHAFISMNNGEFGPVDTAVSLLKEARGVSVSGYYCASAVTKEDTAAFLEEVSKTNLPVFFDPGPIFKRLSDEEQDKTLSLCTYVIANEEEGILLGKADTVDEALKGLAKRTPGYVIIKTGGKGCSVRCPDGKIFSVPGLPAKVVDTTGAGDSFLGAFMYGVMRGASIEAACLIANAAGAVMVGKHGSGDIAPTKDEITAKLREGGHDPMKYPFLQNT